MPKLPRNIKPKSLIHILESEGFIETGGKGSHVRLKHPDGRWTQVAVHSKPIPQGTLRKILTQSKLKIEDLQK